MFCGKLKSNIFADKKMINFTDNKKCRTLFSNSMNHRKNIDLTDNGVTMSNDEKIAEMVNKYFCNIAKSLSLPENTSIKMSSVELLLTCKTCVRKI